MKVIKIKFEYGCFPVWIYGENNEWIENDLPPYLIGDSDIDPKFLNIQKYMIVCIWMMEKNSNILDLKRLKREKIFRRIAFGNQSSKE